MSAENPRPIAPRRALLSNETASSALLLAAAALALVWANSPWRATYEALFGAPIGVRAGRLAFERDLRFWINDGLMAIFFFSVGLEIKRELRGGQLGTVRRAALPVLAALGGMVVPAALYLAINAGTSAARGWGIPMATDVAFAVGVLALLGRRVPPPLRLTLLALAIIDDLGAVLVIAFVFSSGLGLPALAVGGCGLVAIQVLKRLGARSPWAYLPPAIVTWAGAYVGGVHPALAGVAVGLMTPAGPLGRLEPALQPAVNLVIMPIFALANAGVALGAIDLHTGDGARLFLGVTLGLVLGKPIGIFGLAWLAVRLRLARLPDGTSWSGVLVVGVIAGTGFTMSLFMSALALDPGPSLATARLAILAASGVAALAGIAVGRLTLPAQRIGFASARDTTP